MKKHTAKNKKHHTTKRSAHRESSMVNQAGFLSISLKDFMGKNDKIIVSIVTLGIFVLMVLTAFIIMSGGEDSPESQEAVTQISPTPERRVTTPYPTVPNEIRNATVVVNRRAILPQSLTIKTGGRVGFLNEDQIAVEIQGYDNASQILNIGTLQPSRSTIIVFDDPGVFEYVNTVNPEEIAEIIVEE